jgi:hypothetical protein
VFLPPSNGLISKILQSANIDYIISGSGCPTVRLPARFQPQGDLTMNKPRTSTKILTMLEDEDFMKAFCQLYEMGANYQYIQDRLDISYRTAKAV